VRGDAEKVCAFTREGGRKVSVLKDSLKVYINFTYLRWLNLEWSETK